MKRYSEELDIEQILFGYNDMPPTKRRKTDEENIKGRYNLDKVKATKEWTKETFEIQNIRKKAHLLEETKEGTKLKQIIVTDTIQWIGQCKITKQLTNTVINEMKGLLSTRPNTIGIIIYGGSKSSQTESIVETSNSDIFLSHIEELHTIRKQIEIKQSQKGIRTMSITKMFIEEMEDVEFDKNGRILKAKRIKNVSTQIWGTSSTHKKTSRPSASSSRPSVRSSRPFVSSSQRAARNNDISESNDDNRAIILKIYEKLNKLETDFADMKKGQSGMETDIKKIKNEICLLTNDKEFMEDIIVNAAEVILKLNLDRTFRARRRKRTSPWVA
ncbi:hypothetical protein Glove_157g47 [Diversispora epigaea]|uniref:Uncharacterized protein n=1 Tax=Diversispora epigaea TaxID=1348612 RepID=A0A397IWG3_9GLOM|nr:hypothetical protein Glove_157g47 [Diversispora epigaea]